MGLTDKVIIEQRFECECQGHVVSEASNKSDES